MQKGGIIACILLTCGVVSFAQGLPDTTRIHTKKSNQYVGVQINQLLRQIFNFSENSDEVDIPYLITFSSNSATTGHGINIGFGYNFDEFENGDAFTKRETTINDLFFRIGYEKKWRLGKRFIASPGMDLVLDKLKNSTKTEDIQNNNSSIETNTKTKAFGFGPRFALSYQVADRVLIGSEINYYFKSGENESKVKSSFTFIEFDPITGEEREVTQTEETETTEKFKSFKFSLPVVIYLILKF